MVKPGKLDELKCVLKCFTYHIHIILLTETWIRPTSDKYLLEIPNYTHIYNIRNNSVGGGVSIYIHKDLKFNILEEKYISGNNFLWIDLIKLPLTIGVIYKPPDTNLKDFCEIYSSLLEKIKKKSMIIGDFNIDLLRKDNKSTDYIDMLQESGYHIVNNIHEKFSTRDSEHSKSIIDHVCTNDWEQNLHMAVIESSLSDHKQIYVEINTRKKIKDKQKIKYKAIDYNTLYNNIEKENNSNEEYEYDQLELFLKKHINAATITKYKILNVPQKDWINKKIIDSINKRNQVWYKLKADPKNEKLTSEFRIAKENTRRLINTEKKDFYFNSFNKCNKKPKKMWKLINTLAKNKFVNDGSPSKIIINDKEIINKTDICDKFNEYFATIGTDLADKLITSNNSKNLHHQTKNNYPLLPELRLCTEDELIKIIDNLDSNTSCGIDGITTKSLKCIKHLIVNNLTKCINKCLNDGIFPDNLKVAKVTPIYKAGVKTDPGNYRPISVLPVISKIYEKVLFNRLFTHLTNIKFLYKHQYGFRPQSSTLSASIDLITKIKNSIDKKQLALGVFIDLKKAFDTVSHPILLEKLKNLGITEKAFNIFESYLSNRIQITKIDQYESKIAKVIYGVPQGSVLGPLLFLIYINDISNIGLSGYTSLYADDTCLFYFGHTIQNIINEAQKDLNILHSWLSQNLLTINTAKTSYIIFSAKNKKIPDFTPLTINNETINKTNNEKYLGLILDNRLTFKAHIDYLRNKIIPLTGALRNISKYVPYKLRHTIYNALVKPHLEYLIQIWGQAAKTHLQKIQITQNKLIKVLFNFNYLTSSKIIYSKTKLLNIQQLYSYNICILIRKILTQKIHTQINLKKKQHKYYTRNKDNFELPKTRTLYGKKTIEFEGAQLYNKLPNCIKNCLTFNSFKQKLKMHMIEQLF